MLKDDTTGKKAYNEILTSSDYTMVKDVDRYKCYMDGLPCLVNHSYTLTIYPCITVDGTTLCGAGDVLPV